MTSPLSRLIVVEATRDLIVADGLEAVSLRRLAARLGVTAPALYAYVADKHDLLRAVAEGEFERLIATMETIDEPDPVQRLRRLSRAYIDVALREPELFRTMFLFPPDLAVAGATGEELPLATTSFQLALDAVTEAIESGTLRALDPTVAALTLWTATHGAATVLLLGFPFDDVTRDLLIDSVLDTVLAGLAAP
jgi:AcrR family transcriptional regulator